MLNTLCIIFLRGFLRKRIGVIHWYHDDILPCFRERNFPYAVAAQRRNCIIPMQSSVLYRAVGSGASGIFSPRPENPRRGRSKLRIWRFSGSAVGSKVSKTDGSGYRRKNAFPKLVTSYSGKFVESLKKLIESLKKISCCTAWDPELHHHHH